MHSYICIATVSEANDRSTCMPYPRRQRSSWTRIKSSIKVMSNEPGVMS